MLAGWLSLTSNGLPNTGQTSNNNAAIAGDFVLEYLVTADGRIRLKTYARTANYDLINQDKIRTGVAISFQKNFDNIKELFKRKLKNNQQEQEKEKVEKNNILFNTPIKDSIKQ